MQRGYNLYNITHNIKLSKLHILKWINNTYVLVFGLRVTFSPSLSNAYNVVKRYLLVFLIYFFNWDIARYNMLVTDAQHSDSRLLKVTLHI